MRSVDDPSGGAATAAPDPRRPDGAADPAPVTGVSGRWRPSAFDIGPAVLVLLLVALAMTTPRFFSADNVRAILASSAFVGITAIGATLVMISGSVVSLATAQTATVVAMLFLSTQQLGLAVSLLIALAAGVALTALQGAVIGYWNANPIVLTIAAGFALGGAATWFSDGTTVYPESKAFDALNATPLALPLAVYVLLAVAVLAEWTLRRTTAGRQMYLVGENRDAARAAGLPAGRVTVIAWAFFGACIALTGVFLASFHTSATVTLGGTLSLDAIAAVLLGGTAIAGGRGTALQTLGGAVLISVISDVLLLRGFSTGVQILVKGILVLAVVTFVYLRATKGRR
ncbi:ribose transport system permease protein [Actinomadura madurae]|uniref:Ribose transport system permease protein n=1 Tax=Actinomadura madurae TaxID=1993 RepID=A0A1I5WMQ2_9ACTN|nr:ABC transporter permease [Actinomadura madurae]SFQ20867.1 ribose transport system permease protein [Actinomadura madurae]